MRPWTIIGLVLLGYGLAQYRSDAAPPAPEKPCPQPGQYWLELPPVRWPVRSLRLGGQRYGAEALLRLLASRARQPQDYLRQQLAAAKLSLASGAEPSAIAATVAEADQMLQRFATREQMLALGDALEAYTRFRRYTPGCR
ncbi:MULTISPECIES: hypothetical protein [unclassified Meiothermus]|uniref:hypothetical protein n=1 Tax=unclassified Meiothermus TaxID=370471 RepID=UPI000D7CA01B|nr:MULTISPECIES: hypothetical protein [unclassified Meiothermus]PZA06406.1 hypothetical protein DNA98_13600 [Meiothermus sp. Pnk-1]RYM36975.1 hypothetical protein EWH23_07730 [Meiothermus sp. PNK-Is4]